MVRGMVEVFVCHFTRSVMSPANRQTLTHRVKSVEHGKPNCLHLSMESDSQGKPIGKWVKEVGKSECHPIMGWIRVQTLPDTKVGRIVNRLHTRIVKAEIIKRSQRLLSGA
jgi:hypothetical protein